MILETLWYGIIGIAMLMFALLDGFDLGVGILHPFARTDEQRRIFLNSIGPVWDGNEVWLIIVMGGMFAGFPNVYATIFSGFYNLLMVLIACLIFRAVAIEFRSKQESPRWRSLWDWVFSLASTLLTFILGLLLGNMIVGIPLNSEQEFIGTTSSLFNPYSILVGLTAVALFAMHGATYLTMKTLGPTHTVVRQWIGKAILSFLFWYFVTTIATLIYMPHMHIRFQEHPLLALFPLLAFLAILSIPYQVAKKRDGWAFISSCLSIAFLLILYGLGTYPIIVPSTLEPDTNSLTIFNSSSSPRTLTNLLIVVLIGVPLVLAYGFWIYRIFRGKVKLDKSSY